MTQVRGRIADGQVSQFQVGLKIGFRLEESSGPSANYAS